MKKDTRRVRGAVGPRLESAARAMAAPISIGALPVQGVEPFTAWMSCVLPVKTVSELNMREHWAAKARRAKAQIQAVGWGFAGRMPPKPPVAVRMTRIGKRILDTDNLEGALKHVRDGVAKWLMVDDGRPDIRWICRQEIGKEYGVRIEIGPNNQ